MLEGLRAARDLPDISTKEFVPSKCDTLPEVAAPGPATPGEPGVPAEMSRDGAAGEAARLAALRHYNILDTAPEETFDRITRLAKNLLQTPIVLVSLVDSDRQWFKSRQGYDLLETPRAISFCTHAIQQDAPLIVPDALADPAFRNSPLVLGEPHIRFYCGVPLKMHGGHSIGTLCAIDRRPRAFTAEQINLLRDLARLIANEIELRRIATADSLTGVLTRRGFDIEVNRELKAMSGDNRDLSLIAVDIDHFKPVNDRYGHTVGDLALRTLVARIKQELRAGDFIGRLGGDEFAIALPATDVEGARALAERVRRRIADTVVRSQANAIRLTVSVGIAGCDRTDSSWTAMLDRADTALYEAKKSGRNRSVWWAGRSELRMVS
jgi:diguanylate cyclase (GGDEF)-like protein